MTEEERQAWIQLLMSKQFGSYQLTEYLASGGFSFVFEARDVRSGESVAIKILQPGANADGSLEFNRERDLLTILRKSSSVVDIIDSSAAQIPISSMGIEVPLSINYHVLELASGCLEELVLSRDQVSIEELLCLWRGVIRGIHQMHLKGIAHRDLKSPNCLLFVRPQSATVAKVSDLGRSRRLADRSQHDVSDYVVGRGDFRFAPPEFLFLQGADSPRAHKCADIYGIGSLLFEVFTGQGITSLVFGFGPDVLRKSMQLAGSNRRVDLAGLRSNYQPAYRLFEESVPRRIRQPALNLLKQICDPVPEARLPVFSGGKKRSADDGLCWLLRRADILIKGLKRPENIRYQARKIARSDR